MKKNYSPTKEEAVEAIAEIGRKQRERARLQANMNDEIARIKQEYEQEAEPHNEAIKEASRLVQEYCETNRKDLTQDGKFKTVTLSSGEIRWRTTPPRVNIRNAEQVIITLKKLGLSNFLRISEEVNKEAILSDPKSVEGVKGININQREEFAIFPFETELEEVI